MYSGTEKSFSLQRSVNATSGQPVTDVLHGDSTAESARRVPPTVAAATNGTRTEAVHAWSSHTGRLGVRLKGRRVPEHAEMVPH